jgi:hypothetical protein
LPKNPSFIILIWLLAFNHSNAQDIFFCSNYTTKGVAVDTSKTWKLYEKGGYVYVLFSNHHRAIKSKKLILNIREKSGNFYRNYEKRAMDIQNSRTWALLDYQFIEAGNYECSVQDYEGKILATNDITITLKIQPKIENEKKADTITRPIQTKENDPDKSYYNAKTIFCRSIINNIPSDTGSVFRPGELNVEIVNDKALASDSMIVDVFKKGYETEKYPIYITSKNFWIDGSQQSAVFLLNLDQTGEYKIITYNRRSQAISVGFVTIR